MHIKKVFMNSSQNKVSAWIHVLQTGHKQGKVLLEQYPVNMLFSWSVWFLSKKKSTKPPPLFPLFRLLSRNGTICSWHCKQPAVPQPTLTVQLWHSTSYNEGSQCPWTRFQRSLYLLLIERTQRRCPRSLTHLYSFIACSTLALWWDHIVVLIFIFTFWLLQHFFPPLSLAPAQWGICWQPGLPLQAKWKALMVHPAGDVQKEPDTAQQHQHWAWCPQTVSRLKHLPLSEAVKVCL